MKYSCASAPRALNRIAAASSAPSHADALMDFLMRLPPAAAPAVRRNVAIAAGGHNPAGPPGRQCNASARAARTPISNRRRAQGAAGGGPTMETRTPGASRKLSVFLTIAGALTTAANWYMLNAHDSYYPKLAVLGPVALVI